jgi:RNA recognition motif-containing protein
MSADGTAVIDEFKEKPMADRLYVGHLPHNVSKRELDDLFGAYGPLRSIEIKHGGYAFVQYGSRSN